MNIDNDARAILSEFETARKIAVGRFNKLWRWQMRYEEATNYANVRLLVFAGLMETDHPSGRDSDAGKLNEWRERAASKNDPRTYLIGILITKLISDLIDSVKTRKRYLPPFSLEWQQELDPNFDVPQEDNGVHYWNAHYADNYPICTAIYRDGETIESLKRILHRGKDRLYREYRAEMAELRMELA